MEDWNWNNETNWNLSDGYYQLTPSSELLRLQRTALGWTLKQSSSKCAWWSQPSCYFDRKHYKPIKMVELVEEFDRIIAAIYFLWTQQFSFTFRWEQILMDCIVYIICVLTIVLDEVGPALAPFTCWGHH